MDTNLPNHVAIIPDGNRRWAESHSLLPWKGHQEGAKRFWELAQYGADLNIKYMTFWAGSFGNLEKRPQKEVSVLFDLASEYLVNPKVIQQLIDNKTRFKIFGEWESFAVDDDLKQKIAHVEEKTAHFTERFMTILFGYDGQREMLAAVKNLQQTGDEPIDENLRKHLWTGRLPDVDLAIRTGGEPHWSAGFMMWQTANSQFVFDETLWPDFKNEKFQEALDVYASRQRRLGK